MKYAYAPRIIVGVALALLVFDIFGVVLLDRRASTLALAERRLEDATTAALDASVSYDGWSFAPPPEGVPIVAHYVDAYDDGIVEEWTTRGTWSEKDGMLRSYVDNGEVVTTCASHRRPDAWTFALTLSPSATTRKATTKAKVK